MQSLIKTIALIFFASIGQACAMQNITFINSGNNQETLSLPADCFAVSPILDLCSRAQDNITIDSFIFQQLNSALPFLQILSDSEVNACNPLQAICTELNKNNSLLKIASIREALNYLQLSTVMNQLEKSLPVTLRSPEVINDFLSNSQQCTNVSHDTQDFLETAMGWESILASLPWLIKTENADLSTDGIKNTFGSIWPRTDNVVASIGVGFGSLDGQKFIHKRMGGKYLSVRDKTGSNEIAQLFAGFLCVPRNASFNKSGTKVLTAAMPVIGLSYYGEENPSRIGTFLWDLSNYCDKPTHFFDAGGSFTAVFNADETKILSACSNEARLWNIATGEKELTLEHENICAANFSGDNSVIITLSLDAIRLWDAKAGICLNTLYLAGNSQFTDNGSMYCAISACHALFNNDKTEMLFTLQLSGKAKIVEVFHQPLKLPVDALSLEQKLLFFYIMQAKAANTTLDLTPREREKAVALYFSLPQEIRDFTQQFVDLPLRFDRTTLSSPIIIKALSRNIGSLFF